MRDYSISACEKHRSLVLKMLGEDASLAQIGREVGTSGRHVRTFLEKNGLMRHFPKIRPGNRNPKWRGGRTRHKAGYVLIYCPHHPHPNASGVYVFEHRLVMEKLLGRYLSHKEVVHHVNGKKNDNRPENLRLFRSNSLHLKYELTGKTPKWTRMGLARMMAGVLRSAESKRKSSHDRLKLDVSPKP